MPNLLVVASPAYSTEGRWVCSHSNFKITGLSALLHFCGEAWAWISPISGQLCSGWLRSGSLLDVSHTDKVAAFTEVHKFVAFRNGVLKHAFSCGGALGCEVSCAEEILII